MCGWDPRPSAAVTIARLLLLVGQQGGCHLIRDLNPSQQASPALSGNLGLHCIVNACRASAGWRFDLDTHDLTNFAEFWKAAKTFLANIPERSRVLHRSHGQYGQYSSGIYPTYSPGYV